jgi:hypothetical protein
MIFEVFCGKILNPKYEIIRKFQMSKLKAQIKRNSND